MSDLAFTNTELDTLEKRLGARVLAVTNEDTGALLDAVVAIAFLRRERDEARVEAAVRADATRELVEALEQIAATAEDGGTPVYRLLMRCGEIARAALDTAKSPPAG